MDENLDIPIEDKETKKQGWKEFLETDRAVRITYLTFGLLAAAMVMIFLQTRTDAICCGDWDGYYHIKWSSLLWENFSHGKWLPTFEWLPLTVLNPQSYADHHFLFHLLQIPFLWFFDLQTAAKVSTIFYGSLAIFSVYWLLVRYEVKYHLVWFAALMCCANAFFYRMNMAKAPPLTIIITVIGIHLLFQRKYVWLAPLMFAFVWTYSLFPLLWGAALIWTIIIAWNERRFEWRPLAYTTLGLVLGNLINPYFPQNLMLFYEHLMEKFKLASDFAVAVGGEWYSYSAQEILTDFPIAILAMVVGYILFVPRNGKLPEKATFFLAFVSFLCAWQFKSKRFAEYFPPFAILFAAFSWQAFTAPKVAELPDEFRREIDPYLDKGEVPKSRFDKWKEGSAWVLGCILFVAVMLNTVGFHRFGIEWNGVADSIRGNEAADKYKRAMEFATGLDDTGAENIPKGELIFNANWDDFPKLFYYDTKHRYVYGLDPNYLYSEHPDLYKLLKDITEGKTDDPGPQIRDKFGAKYVFTDAKENTDMVAKLLDSGWADMIYEDDEARLLKIRDNKAEPPAEDVDDKTPPTAEEEKELDDIEANDAKNANIDPDDDAANDQ